MKEYYKTSYPQLTQKPKQNKTKKTHPFHQLTNPYNKSPQVRRSASEISNQIYPVEQIFTKSSRTIKGLKKSPENKKQKRT